MMRTVRMAFIVGAVAGVAATQDGRKIELFGQNTEQGVEMRAPKSPGKDQMWEVLVDTPGFFSNSAILVKHRVDTFSVEVVVQRKEPNKAWNRLADMARGARVSYTEKQGDKEPNFSECKLVSEDPKAKLLGLGGDGHSHRVLLTDKGGVKHELIEYFVISSDVHYRAVVRFSKEAYEKYWAADGQFILNNIRRCKVDKK